MKFAALIQYSQDKDLVAKVRPLHRAYLTSLLHEGKLAVAGPLTDDSGALIVYEADTPEAAEEILKSDPFHVEGIFLSWKLYPWKVVFSNHWLLPVQPT